MLVFISDLHLTDGTGGATVPAGAFELFAERLEDLAQRASMRSDGQYRPLDRIEVVLLGDTLDTIRSCQWLSGSVRPWDDPNSDAFLERVATITRNTLAQNKAGLDVLRSLADEGRLRLPPADRNGKPARDAPPEPVDVRIHYMVGNHDWMLHAAGPAYDALRQTVARRLGLTTPANEPFPHDPGEDGTLLDVMRRHRTFARHGDIYDPFNYEGDRDASSLGDALVIELINRFALEVEQSLGDDLPAATLAGLRELDNVRPTLLVPVWVDGLLERTCPAAAKRAEVKRVWDRLVDEFLDLDFVRRRDTWRPNDLVDQLQRLLRFSQNMPLGWGSTILTWLAKLRAPSAASYHQHALGETDFRNRRAKHIVFGHTHIAETVPLDASYAENYVLDQVYFNSGTWRRVLRPTQLAPQQHEFIATDEMTFLAFYQHDERGGRPFETWSGSLGVRPVDAATRRIDVPRRATATTNGGAATQPAAPHFHVHSPARSGETHGV
jgi:UDP-2,3-diacylglucosamine pyrophosphatase LpxH